MASFMSADPLVLADIYWQFSSNRHAISSGPRRRV